MQIFSPLRFPMRNLVFYRLRSKLHLRTRLGLQWTAQALIYPEACAVLGFYVSL